MEAKEIIEVNKLIAEFMGGKMRVENYHGINIIEINGKTFDLFGLKYHSSWDWLIPVCEKCVCEITDADEESRLFAAIHDGLWAFNIDETWSAVTEFIQWYNQNQKP